MPSSLLASMIEMRAEEFFEAKVERRAFSCKNPAESTGKKVKLV